MSGDSGDPVPPHEGEATAAQDPGRRADQPATISNGDADAESEDEGNGWPGPIEDEPPLFVV